VKSEAEIQQKIEELENWLENRPKRTPQYAVLAVHDRVAALEWVLGAEGDPILRGPL